METNIFEYAEEMPVSITKTSIRQANDYKGVISKENYERSIQERWVIEATNEGGYNGTSVDLLDTLRFVKKNMTDVWDLINNES